MENVLIFRLFRLFFTQNAKKPLFPLLDHLEPSGAPPPSGSRLGDGWERFGRRLGDGWEGLGRRLGDVREQSGKGWWDVWETFGRRLGPRRWPELETTARPGEESSGGGGAGWGSRRCGSGQPAVPAGGISPTESSWCQRAPGPEVVPLHSYPRRGLTGTHFTHLLHNHYTFSHLPPTLLLARSPAPSPEPMLEWGAECRARHKVDPAPRHAPAP